MNSISEFTKVEVNMRKRRQELQQVMKASNESVFSMSTFPRLGCPGRLDIQSLTKLIHVIINDNKKDP